MDIFKGLNLLEFSDRFKTDEDCKAHLADFKSQTPYKYLKCNHTACQLLKNYGRHCNICANTESAKVNTLFHKVKFDVRKAFFLCFEMSKTTTNSLPTNYTGVSYGVTEKTIRLFMLKIREAMSSSGNTPIQGVVHVDEFVLDGKEKARRSYNSKKKKAIKAVEFAEDGKVKRIYAMKIDNFSVESLQFIFINYINREAEAVTDKWRAYRPIAKTYNITQIKGNKGGVFKALHTIHQVK